MKRAYQVKTELGNRWNASEYMVIADNAEHAMKIALRQSLEDSGQKISDGQRWRVTSLTERTELPIV